jgi:hypothetical protein
MARTILPLSIPPGVVKKVGPLQAAGRYVDMDKMRFVGDRPEKIGGWRKATAQPFKGISRAALSWNDLSSRTLTAIGTHKKLYALGATASLEDATGTPMDITPIEDVAALTNAFTTVNGERTVTVTHAGHAKALGQEVTFTLADTVGGLAMNGTYEITSVPTSNTYTIEHPLPASASAGPTGSATATYDIKGGTADPAAGFGWGVGKWSDGTWGTPRSTTSIFFESHYWSLSNFGKILLASPFEGALYKWDPTETPIPRATKIPEAPGAMRGMFTTPERFVVALGCSPDTSTDVDPMLLRWSHQGNYEWWNISSTRTAGARRLTEGKKLVAGGAVGQGISLIWTDTAVYSHQYTGSRFVFDTRLAATAAGLAGPKAFTFARGRAFWFGSSAFHAFGGGVQPIPNAEDVTDWLLGQLRRSYEPKTVCFYNQRYGEVWWLFVPEGTSEPAIYVAYNLNNSAWIHGTLTRTAAFTRDAGANQPVLAGTDGYLYLHESGTDADGLPMNAFIQTGPIQAQEGGTLTQVLGFVPDFSDQVGDVQLTVEARDRAPTKVIDRNVASIAPDAGLIDLRIRGRTIAFRMEQNVLGGTFAVGSPSIEIKTGGNRR